LFLLPEFIKHGIYCKKIQIEKVIGENKVLRTDYVCKEFKINFSNENLQMLLYLLTFQTPIIYK